MRRSNETLIPPKEGGRKCVSTGAIPRTLNNSNDIIKQTRQQESTEMTQELLRRASDQDSRIETLDSIFQELELNDDTIVYLEIIDSINQVQDIDKRFQDEHLYLISNWPSSHSDHSYFASDKLKIEQRSFRKTMKLLRRIQNNLAPVESTQENSINTPQQLKARLPEINLIKFEGDYLKWPEFKATFEDVVLKRYELSPSSKFYYLKGSLKGIAATMISHITPSEESLNVAWQLLINRFENKRLIINSHLERLHNLQPIKARSSASMVKIYNTVNETLEALKILHQGDLSHCLLTYHITKLLDEDSRERWETSVGNSNEYPTVTQLLEFLSLRARTLEGLESSSYTQKTNIQKSSQGSKRSQTHTATQKTSQSSQPSQNTSSHWTCDVCSQQHYIVTCPKFRSMTPNQRMTVIHDKVLCIYCLGRHSARNCRSDNKQCKNCTSFHHTMLHGGDMNIVFPRNAQRDTSSARQSRSRKAISHLEESVLDAPPSTSSAQWKVGTIVEPKSSHPDTSKSSHPDTSNSDRPGTSNSIQPDTSKPAQSLQSSQTTAHSVLLATAMATIITETREYPVRMLIDSGSELTFISETVTQQLQLKRSKSSIEIVGIGGKVSTQTKGKVSLNLKSNYRKINLNLEAHVLPKITAVIPTNDIDIEEYHWPHLKNLNLADPQFFKSRAINIIIGADWYGQIIMSNIIRHSTDSVIAHLSTFGWLVLGPVNSQIKSQSLCYHVGSIISNNDLDNSLRTFWEQEEPPQDISSSLTQEEEECEAHFRDTHSRDFSGRYIVRIPLKEPVISLGNSYHTAHLCLQRTIRRFERNNDFKLLYTKFLKEYEDLDHMRKIPADSITSQGIFLPHHGVLRPDSTTTKLRVVFNGSSVTSSKKSLTDISHSGPNLLLNIVDVLTWIRIFRHLFSTDITKMFRQINVHPHDWDLQKILWINERGKEQQYHLTTVTYGTKSAPYLANKVMIQLVEDEGKNYPLAVPSLRFGRYVDDIFGGADTVDQLHEIATQLRQLCMAGGFPLAKWHSTNKQFASENEEQGTSQNDISFDNCDAKILGINWSPQKDTFTFSTKSPTSQTKYTKRQVLSEIATIYDPLGFASPVIIRAKILMQELWLLKVEWDGELPLAIISKWEEIRKDLTDLTRLSIPRWFNTMSDSSVELHGFSDASQLAMAAAIYITVNSPSTGAKTTLICSKTKVAPLKRMTIPRLELTAALLLAKLMSHFKSRLQVKIMNIYLWTDSTVTLTWINSQPSRWKDFVRNRVAQIQELTQDSQWRHIPGNQNPADCASRGVSTNQLENHHLWWTGPPWLTQAKISWPKIVTTKPDESSALEARQGITLMSTQHSYEYHWDLIHRYSTISKLIKVTSNCIKFISKLRKISQDNSFHMETARKFWIKTTQSVFFSNEIKTLQRQQQLSQTHTFSRLTAFIDQDGIIRVGGRLDNSELVYEAKHPAILPRKSVLTELLIRHSHQQTLHGGTQLTLGHLRQRYWILGGRSSIKTHVLKCVTCSRQRAIRANQQMGQLPISRVTPCRAFTHTGVDYAGPLILKTWKGRGAKTFKGWISVFICMATSSAHLELVTDYSTEGFIAAYKRFTARRGTPSHLYSDCGTNFIGADKELQKLFTQYTQENKIIQSITIENLTEWHFNPPAAPHMGGKWEALVKSLKFHIKRTVGDISLTYEETSTLLNQIEAILNSRPLEPLSDDPEDLAALTPGHFLIGTALNAIAEPSLLDLSITRLSRWQFIQQRVQNFWKQWSSQYLHRQQAISKWHHSKTTIQVGTMVLISDERTPPCQWPLARVLSTIPGKDGHIRVVTLKTATTTLTRPISKLVILPVTHTPDKSAKKFPGILVMSSTPYRTHQHAHTKTLETHINHLRNAETDTFV